MSTTHCARRWPASAQTQAPTLADGSKRENVVKPVHGKAMPATLMTRADTDLWLNGTLEQALTLQKPKPGRRNRSAQG
jgi:hypothetical protein